jgi:hypothetical protein
MMSSLWEAGYLAGNRFPLRRQVEYCGWRAWSIHGSYKLGCLCPQLEG